MTNPADHYRTCAEALRALLPRLAEPDQQVAVAAALSLDHAAEKEAALDRALTVACRTTREIGSVRDLKRMEAKS